MTAASADDGRVDEPWVTLSDGFKFAQVPEQLVYDPLMTDGAIRVYAVLVRHGTDPSNCFPGYDRIGKLTGKSSRSIPRLILELEEAGWVERQHQRTPQGDLTSNGYHVFAEPQRATERGVRAPLRGPVRAPERAESAQDRAPKESQVNESQGEGEASTAAGVAVTDDAHRLCHLLADLIEANGSKRPTITEAWLTEADRMLRLDERDPVKADRLIRWTQADPFWRANVLSMPKFRSKYDQLRLLANREREAQAAAVDQPRIPPAWGVLKRQRDQRQEAAQ